VTTMPAVVLTSERQIALQERPQPTFRPDQVMVEVDLCGISGSDLHSAELPQVYNGDCILGYESTAHIAAVGAEVADRSVGQRVAVNPNGNVCGICKFCKAGHFNFCRQATLETALGLHADDALAALIAALPSHLRAIPADLAPQEGAWVEPAATALRAVERAGDLDGRTVLVTGGGPIGQLACRLARLTSPERVLLMEPAAERAQFASKSHATVITADEAGGADASVDVVIECSGNAAAPATALKLLPPGAGSLWSARGQGPDSSQGDSGARVLYLHRRIRPRDRPAGDGAARCCRPHQRHHITTGPSRRFRRIVGRPKHEGAHRAKLTVTATGRRRTGRRSIPDSYTA
jgi:threonine dehydrogenase-like Zn-dependent dehydrogenase